MVTKLFASLIGRNMEVYVDDMLVKSRTVERHEEDPVKAFQVMRSKWDKVQPCKVLI